jgi:uncharacterized protein involved in type VI secretion and phage assembly
MSRTFGVVTGTVVDVDDPSAEGRVLVKMPWLPGDNESYWAPVATLMSGDARGSWFMPEVDDEVLIAFDHGNTDQPFVIGYLWNGAQTPPDDGGASVRRIKTVAGHLLEFHDEDGGHKILLKTAGGQEIELDDTESAITIKTSGSEEVELSPGKVKASTASTSIELDDSAQSATVMAGGGTISMDTSGVNVSHPASLNITCINANVTAAGTIGLTAPIVNVSAPMTTFSGVVMTPTLIATSVVSSSYTPGVGNIW